MAGNDIAFSSFGSLLKAFRKRRHLTQQQLAAAIGMHRSAVVRWEQGDFLPESKTLVLELARHLYLDEQETRQLLEASLTTLSPSWYVPLLRNPFFTGREEILGVLHTQLKGKQAVALTQSSALHGLGGVGKTQIALEYAYRHALEYKAVFWIGAEAAESVLSSLLHIADVLSLPERNEKDQQRVVAAVGRWLSIHHQWLLIWDNLEDPDLFARFMPPTRSGALLITTRGQTLGTLAPGIDLLPMGREEGILFLLRRARVLRAEARIEQIHQLARNMAAEYAAAAELVEEVGGLPLALDQAGAYLEETRCGLPAYLDLFRRRRAALLKLRGERAYNHPASVSTTFRLAVAATRKLHLAVWDLLRVCALLQPDAIPEEIFRLEAGHLGEQLQAAGSDELEWNQLIAVMCSSSLLDRQPEVQTFSMHRLVQAVLVDTMTQAEREHWSRRVIEALDAVFPEIAVGTEHHQRKQATRLLPHALLFLQRSERTEESPALASLAYKAAMTLRAQGRYTEAEPVFLSALRMQEQVPGPEHPTDPDVCTD